MPMESPSGGRAHPTLTRASALASWYRLVGRKADELLQLRPQEGIAPFPEIFGNTVSPPSS